MVDSYDESKDMQKPTAKRMALAYHCMLTLETIFTRRAIPRPR